MSEKENSEKDNLERTNLKRTSMNGINLNKQIAFDQEESEKDKFLKDTSEK